MYKRLLVCTDGSPLAQRAAREGVKLAVALRARVIALLVTSPFEPPAGYAASPLAAQIREHERASKAMAARCLGAIARDAKELGVRCKTLHIGKYPPASTIVETAALERCDLIVLGSHGHGALGQLFVGSVTTRVAAICSVPLLIVRKSKRQAAGGKSLNH
jgi:nucleotide-binding universal stress UspA family protein